MNAINMPGFTAENSLYRHNGQSYACAYDMPYTVDAKIIPQQCTVVEPFNLVVCNLEPGSSGPKPGPDIIEKKCRLGCMRRFPFGGPGLNSCLENC